MNYSISPPKGSMDLLSQIESNMLKRSAHGELYSLFRQCALAVLNTGNQTDNSKLLLEQFKDFEVNIVLTERGIKLELINPPEQAFVDNELSQLLRRNLFSVLRDILFVNSQIAYLKNFSELDLNSSGFLITNMLFSILRNANALHFNESLNLVVCWGGHSINEKEYNYARHVGQELGLRLMNICTGCGPGAMEAPMKGAAVGHAQQNYRQSRFIGITEPSIIAAEPPNPLVNELIIMPDIEKRLETFVRLGHGLLIFPGGVGTAEEFLYILSILMMPENKNQHFPLILTGPKSSADYFETLNTFIINTLGKEATAYYDIIIDDATEVARKMKSSMSKVKAERLISGDAYSFNWSLKLADDLQKPFIPSHQNMTNLDLKLDQPAHQLASTLRKVFSGIVAGNVKEFGIKEIEKNGPYQLKGEPALMQHIDELLQGFIKQHRMKLPGNGEYVPCYRIER